jgi:hypothetical protein
MVDVPITADLVQDPLELNVPGFGFGTGPCAHSDALDIWT